jgi:hypothetical protein
MTDLQFLPWENVVCTCEGHDWGGGYIDVPVVEEFKPYAAAFSNGDTCHEDWFDLEIALSPVCSLKGIGFLDRIHEAETISRMRLSRGRNPWKAEVHFDVYQGSEYDPNRKPV